MTKIAPALAVLLGLLAAGCAPQPAAEDMDLETLLYRECMRSQPGHWNISDAGAAMSDAGSANTASFEASADRKRERRQEMECLKQAGQASD